VRLTQLLSLVLTDSASEQVRKSHERAIKELQSEVRRLDAQGLAGDHAMVALSADQTGNLSEGEHIEFDTISRSGTSINLGTGTGQQNGSVSLAANRTYQIQPWVTCTNAGIANYRLQESGSDLIGDTGVRTPTFRLAGQSAATAISAFPSSGILVTPTSAINVVFARVAGGSDASAVHIGSRIWIQEVA
jgi:hypothetical protein